MPEEVGVAYVRLRFNTSGMAEEARSEVGSALRGVRETVPVRPTVNRAQAESTLKRDLGGAVKSTIGYIGGIFAAEKVFEFGKEVIGEAAIVQKAQESIRAEYGKSADQVTHFAEGQATQLGISAAASETASAKLGALFQNLGFGAQKSAGFNLELQKVVGGLSQIKGVDPTAILSKLNTTMATGSTRGLRDLGIALDSVTVKSEAMRLGLVKTTVDQGTLMAAQDKAKLAQENLAKVQAASGQHSEAFHQATIANVQAHEALKKAIQGTAGPLTVQAKDQAILSLIGQHQNEVMHQAAAHQGDAANQAKILSAEWQNMKAAIGEALLPVFTSFVQELVKGVTFLKDNREIVVNIAEAIAIATAAYTAWRAAVFAANLVTEVATGLQRILNFGFTLTKAAQVEATAATEAQTVAQEELNTAMYLNPMGLVAAAIIVVAVGLFELYQHSATARRIMNELWDDLKSLGLAALHSIGPAIHGVIDAFHDVVGAAVGVGHAVSGAVSDVADAIRSGVHTAEGIWSSFWGGPFGDEVKFGIDLAIGYVQQVVRTVTDVVNLVGDLIHGRWGAIWGDVEAVVGDAIMLVLRELLAAPALVLHAALLIGKAIKDPVINEAKALPGQIGGIIHALWADMVRGARIVGGAARDLGLGILHAVIDEAKALPGQIWGLIQAIGQRERDGAIDLGRGAVAMGRSIVNGVINVVTRLPGQAIRFIQEIVNRIHDLDIEFLHAAQRLGSELVHGIISGIEHAPGDVANAVKGKAEGALSAVGSALGIGSPSRVFAEKIGKPISDGIVLGAQPLHDDMRNQMTQQMTRIQNEQGPLWHDQFHDNVGRPISQGVVQGTNNLQTNLGSAIVNAAHGAIAHARSALGIHSPSALFAEQVGKPMADGIVHGLGGLEAALAKKITAAAQSAMSTASGGFGSVSPQGSAAVGYNQRLGYQMMLAAGWPASQWGALQALWTRESGWNANAVNSSSGAYGIPQALGHGHPFNLGDARAQIAWGLEYIRGRYGSPSAAWAHEEAIGWYQGGGVAPGYPGQPSVGVLHGGEVVFTPEQIGMLGRRGITINHLEVHTPSAAGFISELDAIARSL